MKEKIKKIYLVLGIILLALIITHIGLDIFGLMSNIKIFTYDEKKCRKHIDVLYEIWAGKPPSGELPYRRPSLFIERK